MAEAYLNENATSLAAANWSDGVGFQNGAQLVIAESTVSIQTALDQSGLVTGIEYLDILGGNPVIGGSAGPLKFDADGTAESAASLVSRLRYHTDGGALYYQAAGGNNLAHYVIHSGRGRLYGLGGTWKHFHCSGQADLNDTTVSTAGSLWYFSSGASVRIQDNATAITDLTCVGTPLSLYLERGATALDFAGSEWTLDTTRASTTIKHRAGTMRILKSGTITDLYCLGGLIDFSGLQRSMTVTTLWHTSAATIKLHPLLTITNRRRLGAGSPGMV